MDVDHVRWDVGDLDREVLDVLACEGELCLKPDLISFNLQDCRLMLL